MKLETLIGRSIKRYRSSQMTFWSSSFVIFTVQVERVAVDHSHKKIGLSTVEFHNGRNMSKYGGSKKTPSSHPYYRGLTYIRFGTSNLGPTGIRRVESWKVGLERWKIAQYSFEPKVFCPDKKKKKQLSNNQRKLRTERLRTPCQSHRLQEIGS